MTEQRTKAPGQPGVTGFPDVCTLGEPGLSASHTCHSRLGSGAARGLPPRLLHWGLLPAWRVGTRMVAHPRLWRRELRLSES